MKKTDSLIAFLGKETKYEGKLTFSGAIRIDGRFTGQISAAGTLIVGQTAVVEADIHISRIVITGEIHGNITADNIIEIHPSGKMFGDIQSPTVVIHEKGIFDGNCRMPGKEVSDAGTWSAVQSSQYADESRPALGTIHGTVTNHQPQGSDVSSSEKDNSPNPIQGAKISAQCNGLTSKNAITDDTGFYELTDLEDGTWNLLLEAHGYNPIHAELVVRGGGTYTQHFDCKSQDKDFAPHFLDEKENK